MNTRKSTMVELVDELKKLPQSSDIKLMIDEAKAGEYHDYKNRKYVCGKIVSSRKLRALGYIDLAKRIEAGEFDEEADDIDKQKMRAELNQLPKETADALKKQLGL